MLERVADLTWKRPKLVLALVGAFMAVAGALAHNVEDHLKAAGFSDSASESERATRLLRHTLGYDAQPGVVLLVKAPHGGRLDLRSAKVRREVQRLSGELSRARFIGHVTSPFSRSLEARNLRAKDGESLLIAGRLSTDDPENDGEFAADDARRIAASSSLDVSVGGFAPGFDEVASQTRKDLTNAELIAFPILALLLLVVFRGVIAAAIPLLLGGISILGAFLVLRVMSVFVDTSVFALNIATGLSLGLAVDYALLMISRYREELAHHGPTREAHRTTVLTAGRTAVFSGLTVAAAMIALAVFPMRFLYSVAVAGATVGVLSALVGVLFVPSMLALLGERIDSLSVRRGPAVSDTSGGWYRLAHGVMRRPVRVALGSAALVIAAALPLTSTVLTGPSAEAVPPSKPSYTVNDYMKNRYSRALVEGVTVTVHGRASDAELARLRRQIASIDGLVPGAPFVRASRDVAFASFSPLQPALDQRTQDAVDEIRDRGGPPGTQILVSGNTARFIDQKDSLMDHLPLVAGIVAATTLLLLFMLTGSIILPLKTLVMNGMTLAATLGIVVLSFQEGLLDSPLDYTGPAAVEVTSLVFLFAVIFGLATDYAVLVMARIKEHHDQGASNEEAVASGIARTGRVITAAAVMIAVVFGAFAVSEVFFMKQIAVGQAMGVLIDATIVRALLVPSLMRLFGDWNWWAPRPLKRFQERFGFSHA
jgi:RND superfamily putative drug exporter